MTGPEAVAGGVPKWAQLRERRDSLILGANKQRRTGLWSVFGVTDVRAEWPSEKRGRVSFRHTAQRYGGVRALWTRLQTTDHLDATEAHAKGERIQKFFMLIAGNNGFVMAVDMKKPEPDPNAPIIIPPMRRGPFCPSPPGTEITGISPDIARAMLYAELTRGIEHLRPEWPDSEGRT